MRPNPNPVKSFLSAGMLALLLLATANASAAEAEATAAEPASLAGKVLGLTGARTKIIWVHSVAGKGEGWDALAAEYELRGFDTVDGKIRTILPGPASYANPCLTPDGNVVFYTDVTIVGKEFTKSTIYRVNFDGTEKRAFCKGYSLCTWKDPKDGSQWIYFTSVGYGKGPILRCRIDKPEEPQVVWDKDQATHTVTISADGTRVGSCWPHPKAGVANLQTQTLRQYGRGCNACLAPDNSYRFFHMGEEVLHSGIIMYDDGGINKRPIWFTGLPNRGPQDDSWVPRWSNDARFFTVGSPICGPKQQVYLGQFNERFTAVDKWIQITDEPGQNVKAIAWIDIGLGSFSGKAPYTVEIPAPGNGTWQWEFSDGGKTGDSPARHTFAKPGAYTVTARQGDRSLKGRITVLPPTPPRLTSTRLLDDTHVLVRFDQRVQLKDATASLAGAGAAKSVTLDPEGFTAIVETAVAIGAADKITLRGVFDTAQVPNALDGGSMAVTRPTWPSFLSDIAFMWQGNKDPGLFYSLSKKAYVESKMGLHFDRNGALRIKKGSGGVSVVSDIGESVGESLSNSKAFSLEMLLIPGQPKQPDDYLRRVILMDGNGATFEIVQAADKLRLDVQTASMQKANRGCPMTSVPLVTLADDRPLHLIVTYQPGSTTVYANGKQVATSDKIQGEPFQVPHGKALNIHLATPNPWKSWTGKMEGIVLYNRVLTRKEAARDYRAYAAILAGRKVVPQVQVKAVLLTKSDIPKAEDIAPYIHALTVCEYEVSQVMKGVYKEKKIRVAQWGLRDRQPTSLASTALRSESTLTLEAFTEHSELENEVLRDTLPENLDMPLFVPADE